MKNSLTLTMLILVLAAACGDSGSNRVPAPEPVVDTDDVMVVGPITGFGSVIVNGMEFDTDAATVTMDHQPGIVSDLRIGMVASIGGTVNPDTGLARASQISFVDDAEGPITSIDRAAGSFLVLGRMIFADELTVFKDATFEDLEVGHVVKVSGLWKHQQQIQATFVHRTALQFEVGMAMQVKGEITDLDIGQQHFRIGTQTCDYSAAMLELGGAEIANGMYVQVTSNAMIQNGRMMANMVQVRDQDRDRYRLCAGECFYADRLCDGIRVSDQF